MEVLTEESGGLTIKAILRSFLAVIGGSVAIFLSTFATIYLMRLLVPDIFASVEGDNNATLLISILACSTGFWALGGYITAWLTDRKAMKHVVALGLIQFIGGLAVAIQAGDALPRWFSISGVVLPIPVICLGGYLQIRKTEIR